MMTKEEIENSNKLIAEFMGYRQKENGGLYWGNEGLGGIYIEEMKYHSSWDWLMPCIDKIQEINNYVISTTTTPTISEKWVIHKIKISENTFKGLENPFISVESAYSNKETKLSMYYRFCVKFIEYHNSTL